jgi:hypothetical protein
MPPRKEDGVQLQKDKFILCECQSLECTHGFVKKGWVCCDRKRYANRTFPVPCPSFKLRPPVEVKKKSLPPRCPDIFNKDCIHWKKSKCMLVHYGNRDPDQYCQHYRRKRGTGPATLEGVVKIDEIEERQ